MIAEEEKVIPLVNSAALIRPGLVVCPCPCGRSAMVWVLTVIVGESSVTFLIPVPVVP